MSVLTNAQLATAISTSNCGNCENVNEATLASMGSGSAIFVVSVGRGGNGVDSAMEDDIVETLEQISETDATAVNKDITTDYSIVSQNGFPN